MTAARPDQTDSATGSAAQRRCPACGESAVIRHGSFRMASGQRVQRYLCKSCWRTFSPNTGTPAHRIHKQRAWREMIELLADNLPLRQVASRLNIALSTAFRWRHRALAVLAQKPRTQLEGRVCVGCFYIRYSEKGSRICNGPGSWGYDHWLRKGVLDPTRTDQRFRLLADGRPNVILVAQNEQGYQLFHLGQGRVTADRLATGLKALLRPGSEVYAYQQRHFEAACRQSNLQFRDANRALALLYDRKTEAEEYWADLPAAPEYAYGWFRQFNGIATRYLEHYMVWYCEVVRKLARNLRRYSDLPELGMLTASA